MNGSGNGSICVVGETRNMGTDAGDLRVSNPDYL